MDLFNFISFLSIRHTVVASTSIIRCVIQMVFISIRRWSINIDTVSLDALQIAWAQCFPAPRMGKVVDYPCPGESRKPNWSHSVETCKTNGRPKMQLIGDGANSEMSPDVNGLFSIDTCRQSSIVKFATS